MGEFNIWYFVVAFVFIGAIGPYLVYSFIENLGGILVLIVVVLAILAVIAIPAYMDYIIRSQISSGISLTYDIKSKVENYYSKNREIPNNNSLIDTGKIPVSSVINLSLHNGNTIEIEFKEAAEKLLGKKIIYKATIEKNSFVWSCTTNIEEIDKYFPENARGLCHFAKLSTND
ncbi:MAG: pilin [Candidatus Competibacteraceae bacterium]